MASGAVSIGTRATLSRMKEPFCAVTHVTWSRAHTCVQLAAPHTEDGARSRGETRPWHFQSQINRFTLRKSIWFRGVGTLDPPRADVAEASVDRAEAGWARAPVLVMRRGETEPNPHTLPAAALWMPPRGVVIRRETCCFAGHCLVNPSCAQADAVFTVPCRAVGLRVRPVCTAGGQCGLRRAQN